MSDLQDKVQSIFDIIQEEQWEAEDTLRVLTTCLASVAIAVNVPIEVLEREAGNMVRELYARHYGGNDVGETQRSN